MLIPPRNHSFFQRAEHFPLGLQPPRLFFSRQPLWFLFIILVCPWPRSFVQPDFSWLQSLRRVLICIGVTQNIDVALPAK